MKRRAIRNQVKQHLAAIISLLAAIGGFMFDTWQAKWLSLVKKKQSEAAVSQQIAQTRQAVLLLLIN